MRQRSAMLSASLCGLLVSLSLTGCRGEDGDPFTVGSLSRATLSGTVRSITASQTEMSGWVLVMMERDTGISRVDTIGPIGNYQLSGVLPYQAHTLLLLDPQFRFSAILTSLGEQPNTVRQYFTLTGTRLPTLVQSGPVINFADSDGISWEANRALDSNGNQIPDGLDFGLVNAGPLADTDGDGISNINDPDINGNGIPNWFDSDSDGDGILDIFDPDANGDGILDIAQDVGDYYFNRGLSYIVVQVAQEVQSDSSLATTLLFTTKTHHDYSGEQITVRGPSILFDGAVAVTANKTGGDFVTSSWDGILKDDGQNEDGSEGDGVFGRLVRLRSGAAPRANQVIFFRVQQSDGEDRYFDEFPFTFPHVTTGVLSATYDANSGVVTKSGQPFGTLSSYTWSLHIFDASGIKVFSSQPVAGTTDEYTIPAGILDSSQTYSANVVASSLAGALSYPAWIIRSESFGLQ